MEEKKDFKMEDCKPMIRNLANDIVEAYKNNTLEELMNARKVNNIKQLIELAFKSSRNALSKYNEIYKSLLIEAKEEYKKTKKFKKVEKKVSYVKMPLIEYDSIEKFIVMYCVASSISCTHSTNISNFTDFARKYLGFELSKDQKSALVQLIRRGFKVSMLKDIYCSYIWNKRTKSIKIEFDIDKYNKESEGKVNEDEALELELELMEN